MGIQSWSPRLFMGGAFAVVVLILGNNMVLTMDPSPGKSWDDPIVDGNSITFQMTFQLDSGDRITIDLDRWLQNFQINTYDAYQARLYQTPAGQPNPQLAGANPVEESSGHKEDISTPRRMGTFIEPTPPTWTVQTDGWVTIELALDHGGRAPTEPAAQYWYGQAMNEKFLSDGFFGPDASPIQVIPNAGLRAQVAFNILQPIALGFMVAGGVLNLRSRPWGDGLEGQLDVARRSVEWLRQLADQLWLTGAGILLLAFLLSLTLEAGGFVVREQLQPDGWYLQRISFMLLLTFLFVIGAWLLRMKRIRGAMQRIPTLDLDD